MGERDDRLESGIRRVLDDDVARLDEATRDRLRRARQHALTRAEAVPRFRRWMPAGAVLASTLIVALLWYEQRPAVAPLGPEDFELLTSQEPIDLYRDLEFYEWLAQERDHAG